jgi:hypothetical protein
MRTAYVIKLCNRYTYHISIMLSAAWCGTVGGSGDDGILKVMSRVTVHIDDPDQCSAIVSGSLYALSTQCTPSGVDTYTNAGTNTGTALCLYSSYFHLDVSREHPSEL